jgi:hypothetical protein
MPFSLPPFILTIQQKNGIYIFLKKNWGKKNEHREKIEKSIDGYGNFVCSSYYRSFLDV